MCAKPHKRGTQIKKNRHSHSLNAVTLTKYKQNRTQNQIKSEQIRTKTEYANNNTNKSNNQSRRRD